MADHLNNSGSKPVEFSCSICFQPFNFNGGPHSICALLCGHTFGKSCVIDWFKVNQNQESCPVCRTTVVDMKEKISSNNSSNDVIIDLHGCTDNGLIEAIIKSNKEIIKEYEEKMKTLRSEMNNSHSIEVKYLVEENSSTSDRLELEERRGESLLNILRRMVYKSSDYNFDESNVDEIDVLLDDLKEVRDRMARRNLNQSDSLEMNQEVGGSALTRDIRNDNTNVAGTAADEVNSETVEQRDDNNISTNDPNPSIEEGTNPKSLKFVATLKRTISFIEIFDACCIKDLIVAAVQNVDTRSANKMFGLLIISGNKPYTYSPLSDRTVIGVKMAVDSTSSTRYNIVAACEEGKYYEISINFRTLAVESYFEGYIGNSILEGRLLRRLLHKPTSLIWLSPTKYVIGTTKGKIFVKEFGNHLNGFKNINYIGRTKRQYNIISKKPVKYMAKYSDETIFCCQSNRIFMFDERFGRLEHYVSYPNISSISFNPHLDLLTIIREADRKMIIELWKVKFISQSNIDIEYDLEKYMEKEISHNNYGIVKVPTILYHETLQNYILNFFANDMNFNLELLPFSDIDVSLNTIEINEQSTLKVIIEEGKYCMRRGGELKVIIIQYDKLLVYKLKAVVP